MVESSAEKTIEITMRPYVTEATDSGKVGQTLGRQVSLVESERYLPSTIS